jgi:ferritin-like metal-binding protein YciE
MPRRKRNAARNARKGTTSSKPRTHRKLTLNDKMIVYLNEALSIENAAVPRLQSRIKETPLPAAKAQLRHHLEETREQQFRLRKLISNLGGRPVSEKARLPFAELPKRLAADSRVQMTAAEQELKSAKGDAIIENAEVVMYDTLMQLAQQMANSDAIPVLTQNLSEERKMADWLRGNMPVVIAELYPKIESSVNGNMEHQERQTNQGTKVAET